MIRTFIIASLAASALGAAAVADETIVIDISNIDLDNPAAASAVYDQVVVAAEKVCATLYLDAPLSAAGLGERRRLYAGCVEDTVTSSIETAGAAPLTLIHAAQDITASFEVAAQ